MAHNPFESLENRLIRLEELILDIKHSSVEAEGPFPQTGFMDINGLQEYLPNHPAKSTIYRWVSQKDVPCIKRGKSLYFQKTAIDLWLKEGERITSSQLKVRALSTMNRASRPLKRA